MSHIVTMPRRAGKSWVSKIMRRRQREAIEQQVFSPELVVVDDLAADELAVEAIRDKLKGHPSVGRSVYLDDAGHTTHVDLDARPVRR